MSRTLRKSNRPINFTFDLVGDTWSLLILRDIHLFVKRRYKNFLESEEAISINILAGRLGKLERNGLLEKIHGLYQPTQKGLDLLPLLIELSLWSSKYCSETSHPLQFTKWAIDVPAMFRKSVEKIANGKWPPPLVNNPN